jgi:hypothetical protein
VSGLVFPSEVVRQGPDKAILDYRMPTGDDSEPFTAQEQMERGLAASSNLRIMPPPLWTQYNYPLQYRSVVQNANRGWH